MTETIDHAALPAGDLRLLDSPVAQRLLASESLGHLGYLGKDGTPRVIPVGWLWTGDRIVFGTFAASPKIDALRAHPQVALTVDRPGPPPEVLQIRCSIAVEETEGVPDEYRQVQIRSYGEQHGAAAVEAIERSGARMARLTITPTWVDVLDFQTRSPRAVVAAGLAG